MKLILLLLPAFTYCHLLQVQGLPACITAITLGVNDKVKVATYKGDTCYVVERNAPYPPGTSRHQVLMAGAERRRPGYVLPEVYNSQCQPLRFIKAGDVVYTSTGTVKKKAENVAASANAPAAQWFYVRTVSGVGIVPVSTLSIINGNGHRATCSYKTALLKSAATHCTIDSLLNQLLRCTNCAETVPAKQCTALALVWQKLKGQPVAKVAAGYAQAVYSVYKKEGTGAAVLQKTFTKGSGSSAADNALIDDFIRLLNETELK